MKNMISPVAYKTEVPVFSDKYLNDKETIKKMEQYCEPIPVDMNVGYVPVDKSSSDNLKEIEDNIQGRFSL